MSFQPPPPPAGPPAFGSPLQSGPPQPYGGGAPAKKRSPLPWIIGAAVLVIAAIVVIVLVAGGGGGSGVDAEGASAGFSAVVDDADFDETGTADLRQCPMGDAVDLTDEIGDDIDTSDDLLDGDASQVVLDRTDTSPEVIVCTLSAVDDVDGPTSVNYLANSVPSGDYVDFLEESFGDGADVDVDDPVDGSGGVFYSYCGQADGGDEACGTDWVDEEHDIVLGYNVIGDRITGEDARDVLEEILSTMADGLAAEA